MPSAPRAEEMTLMSMVEISLGPVQATEFRSERARDRNVGEELTNAHVHPILIMQLP